jgi:hypothetical protein
MSIEFIEQERLKMLSEWWLTNIGSKFLKREVHALQNTIKKIPAQKILLLAPANYWTWDNALAQKNIIRCDLLTDKNAASLVKVDMIIIPHWLGFDKQAKAWIEMSWKYLEPGGHLIYISYSNGSFLGLCHLLKIPFAKKIPRYIFGKLRILYWVKKMDFKFKKLVIFSLLAKGSLFVWKKKHLTVNVLKPIWGSNVVKTEASEYARKSSH